MLAIKEIYIEILLALTQHDQDKLRELNIDYILDGFKKIKLQRTTGDKVFFFSEKKRKEIEKRVVLCMLQFSSRINKKFWLEYLMFKISIILY